MKAFFLFVYHGICKFAALGGCRIRKLKTIGSILSDIYLLIHVWTLIFHLYEMFSLVKQPFNTYIGTSIIKQNVLQNRSTLWHILRGGSMLKKKIALFLWNLPISCQTSWNDMQITEIMAGYPYKVSRGPFLSPPSNRVMLYIHRGCRSSWWSTFTKNSKQKIKPIKN